jgi:hypothetical protein
VFIGAVNTSEGENHHDLRKRIDENAVFRELKKNYSQNKKYYVLSLIIFSKAFFLTGLFCSAKRIVCCSQQVSNAQRRISRVSKTFTFKRELKL